MDNWTKQAEDMVKTWTDAQKKMNETWLEALQSMGSPKSGEMWTKATGAWEQSVKQALDAQTEWSRMWLNSFTSSPNMPKEAVEWAKQGQAIMSQWTESQKRLWEGWLDLVKKMDVSQISTNWDAAGAQNLLKTWQDATQKAMEAQAEWIRRMTSMTQSGKSGSTK